MNDARSILWALAAGEDVRLSPAQAAELNGRLFDLARDNARLVKRIEHATKDLQTQADQLAAQVVTEEARAVKAERAALRWRAIAARLAGRAQRMRRTIRELRRS